MTQEGVKKEICNVFHKIFKSHQKAKNKKINKFQQLEVQYLAI